MPQLSPKSGHFHRIGSLVLGWMLVLIGVAALVLPGPGLLALVAGLTVLSTQYAWAKRWLRPVKRKAFAAAAEGVRTKGRISLSCLGGLLLIAAGVAWGMQPPVPGMWPLSDRWWLPGGWSVGSSLILSGILALGFIVYSIRRFRPRTSAAPGT